MDWGLISKEAVSKPILKHPLVTEQQNYKYLTSLRQQENMCTSKDFLHWYNNKNVAPTLEVLQKIIDFCQNKGIDMVKRCCILPNLAVIAFTSQLLQSFLPSQRARKICSEKFCGDMVGGPRLVFTRKAFVDKTFARDSTNLSKSIVEIDASQLYCFSMCQAMPTGLYTRWQPDSESSKHKLSEK